MSENAFVDRQRNDNAPSDLVPTRTKGAILFIAALFLALPSFSEVQRMVLPDGWTVLAVPPATPSPEPSPVPSPSPTPAPSANSTEPLVQHMVLENGVYKSLTGWQKDAASLQFKTKASYGDTVTLEFERTAGYPTKGKNIKILRVWAKDTGQYPNFYVGTQKDGSWRFYVEPLNVVSGQTSLYFKVPPYAGKARTETYTWKNPSAVGRADGWLTMQIDGQEVFKIKSLQVDSIAKPGIPDLICIQDDYSPASGDSGPPPADAFVSYKLKRLEVSK